MGGESKAGKVGLALRPGTVKERKLVGGFPKLQQVAEPVALQARPAALSWPDHDRTEEEAWWRAHRTPLTSGDHSSQS